MRPKMRSTGPDARGDELPAELQRREQRLAAIAAAKARLEARQADEDRRGERARTMTARAGGLSQSPRVGVPPDNAQDNFTTRESRIMRTAHGFNQCYNGQSRSMKPRN